MAAGDPNSAAAPAPRSWRAPLRPVKRFVIRSAELVEVLSHALVQTLRPPPPSEPEPDPSEPEHYRDRWVPPDEEMARLAILNTADRDIFERTALENAELMAPFIGSDAVVVDVGCGIGRVALRMAERCAEIWCVDVSPEMIAFARERLAAVPNARFVVSEGVTASQVPDEAADFVYSILVLQHLEREDAFVLLKDLHRFTRPGGRALFTFPNLLSDQGLAGFLRNVECGEVTNLARARVYTPQEVRRLLPEAGWDIEETLGEDPDILVLCRRK